MTAVYLYPFKSLSLCEARFEFSSSAAPPHQAHTRARPRAKPVNTRRHKKMHPSASKGQFWWRRGTRPIMGSA